MKRAAAGSLAAVLLLAACGGGGQGGSALPSHPVVHPTGMGTLQVRITIPGSASIAKTSKLRRALAAAETTSGILFTVYASSGGSPGSPLATSGADVSSASPFCTVSGSGRSCTVGISSPAGTVNILAQTYDQVIPSNGVVPANAHLLAAGVVSSVTVTAGQSANVSLTANPVLSTVALNATPATVHSLIPAKVSLAVSGFDAGGNLILAGNYVDQNGDPVTVTLSLATNPNNSAALSTTSVAGSGQAVQLTYNGAANTSGSLSVSSSAPYSSTVQIGLLAPVINSVADANLSGNGGGFDGIAPLNGGGSAENYIFYTTPSNDGASFVDAGAGGMGFTGVPASQTPNPIATSQPVFGDMEFDASNQTFYLVDGFGSLGQMAYLLSDPPTLSSPEAAATCTATAPATCNPTAQLAVTTAGTLLYGDGQGITEWPASFGSNATRIATITGTHAWAGAYWDYNYPISTLWLADSAGTGAVYEAGLSGGGSGNYTSSYQYANTSLGVPWGVTADFINHNGWVTFPQAKLVAKFTDPINSTTPVTFPTTGNPQYIAVDANAVWFSETTPTGMSLGRIDLVTNVLSEYPLVTNGAGGIAGPIIDMANYQPGAVLGVVFFSGSSSPGQIVLVTP